MRLPLHQSLVQLPPVNFYLIFLIFNCVVVSVLRYHEARLNLPSLNLQYPRPSFPDKRGSVMPASRSIPCGGAVIALMILLNAASLASAAIAITNGNTQTLVKGAAVEGSLFSATSFPCWFTATAAIGIPIAATDCTGTAGDATAFGSAATMVCGAAGNAWSVAWDVIASEHVSIIECTATSGIADGAAVAATFTQVVTFAPSSAPTSVPTAAPSTAPTTAAPSTAPTTAPTTTPSTSPTASCAKGTWRDGAGCTACLTGTFSDAVNESVCKDCEAGKFNGQLSSTSSSACQHCGDGSFSPAAAASACSFCEAGKWSTRFPNGVDFTEAGVSVCSDCSILGWWCDGAGARAACVAGRHANNVGLLSSATQCVACAAGKLSATAGAADDTACEPCTAGCFCGEGSTPVTKQTCPSGSFSNASGNAAASDCETCLNGTYSLLQLDNVAGTTKSCTHANNAWVACDDPLIGITVCKACPAKGYCAGDGMVRHCPTGRYSSAPSSTVCVECSAGKYMITVGATACTNCVKGRASASLGIAFCAGCNIGRYSDTTGLTECKACASGKFQKQGYKSSCSWCAEGKAANLPSAATSCPWCAQGKAATSGAATCVDCTSGTYAAGGKSECKNCSHGYTPNQLLAAFSCSACEQGKIAASGEATCSDCGSGMYAEAAKSVCKQCLAGSIPNLLSAAFSCSACSNGRYSGAAGVTSCAGRCDIGRYGTTAGAVDEGVCAECPGGRVAIAGSPGCAICPSGSAPAFHKANCSNCSLGRFSPSPGHIACVPCESGSVPVRHVGAVACRQCKPTTFAVPTDYRCSNCSAGLYSSASGQSACLPCSAGLFSLSNAAICEQCDPGKHQMDLGQTVCADCEAGLYSRIGWIVCEACVKGRFSSLAQGSCSNCSLGTWSGLQSSMCTGCEKGRFTNVSRSTACQKCDAGKYANADGLSVCEACAVGSYTPMGSRGTVDCTPCPGGRWSTKVGAKVKDFCNELSCVELESEDEFLTIDYYSVVDVSISTRVFPRGRAKFTCAAGYLPSNPSPLTCVWNGEAGNTSVFWAGAPPICLGVQCPVLSQPDYAKLVYGPNPDAAEFDMRRFPNASTSVTCNAGYDLFAGTALSNLAELRTTGTPLPPGSYTRNCTVNGAWDGTDVVCVARECSEVCVAKMCPDKLESNYPNKPATALGNPQNPNGRSYPFGVAEFTCSDNTPATCNGMQGCKRTLQCGDQGKWIGDPPMCAAAICEPLKLPRASQFYVIPHLTLEPRDLWDSGCTHGANIECKALEQRSLTNFSFQNLRKSEYTPDLRVAASRYLHIECMQSSTASAVLRIDGELRDRVPLLWCDIDTQWKELVNDSRPPMCSAPQGGTIKNMRRRFLDPFFNESAPVESDTFCEPKRAFPKIECACPPGSRQPPDYGIGCILCGPGTFTSVFGEDACAQCPTAEEDVIGNGTERPWRRLREEAGLKSRAHEVATGSVQPFGSAACQDCTKGKFVQDGMCLPCKAGEYAPPPRLSCRTCPRDGVDCVSDAGIIRILDDFWHDPDIAAIPDDRGEVGIRSTTQFYRCTLREACLVNRTDGIDMNENAYCHANHSGVLCQRCRHRRKEDAQYNSSATTNATTSSAEEDVFLAYVCESPLWILVPKCRTSYRFFALFRRHCEECDSGLTLVMVATTFGLAMIAVGCVAFLVMSRLYTAWRRLGGKVRSAPSGITRIFLNFLQLTSSLNALKLKPPSMVSDVTESTEAAQVSLAFFPIQCTLRLNFYSTRIIYMALPLIAFTVPAIGVALVIIGARFFQSFQHSSTGAALLGKCKKTDSADEDDAANSKVVAKEGRADENPDSDTDVEMIGEDDGGSTSTKKGGTKDGEALRLSLETDADAATIALAATTRARRVSMIRRFNVIDTDGSGTIDTREILRTMGNNGDKWKVANMMRTASSRQGADAAFPLENEELTLDEYAKIDSIVRSSWKHSPDIWRRFAAADEDGSGRIDINEMRAIMPVGMDDDEFDEWRVHFFGNNTTSIGIEEYARLDGAIRRDSLSMAVLTSFVLCVFCIYGTVTRALLAAFSVQSIEGHQLLTLELHQKAFTPEHIILMAFAAIWLFGFTFMVPMTALCILIKNRHRLNNRRVSTQYGFLTDGYREKYYYWEFVVLLRKVVILMVAYYIEDAFFQSFVSLVVLLSFLLMQLVFNPYIASTTNVLETFSISTVLATQLGSLMMWYTSQPGKVFPRTKYILEWVVTLTLMGFYTSLFISFGLSFLISFVRHSSKKIIAWFPRTIVVYDFLVRLDAKWHHVSIREAGVEWDHIISEDDLSPEELWRPGTFVPAVDAELVWIDAEGHTVPAPAAELTQMWREHSTGELQKPSTVRGRAVPPPAHVELIFIGSGGGKVDVEKVFRVVPTWRLIVSNELVDIRGAACEPKSVWRNAVTHSVEPLNPVAETNASEWVVGTYLPSYLTVELAWVRVAVEDATRAVGVEEESEEAEDFVEAPSANLISPRWLNRKDMSLEVPATVCGALVPPPKDRGLVFVDKAGKRVDVGAVYGRVPVWRSIENGDIVDLSDVGGGPCTLWRNTITSKVATSNPFPPRDDDLDKSAPPPCSAEALSQQFFGHLMEDVRGDTYLSEAGLHRSSGSSSGLDFIAEDEGSRRGGPLEMRMISNPMQKVRPGARRDAAAAQDLRRSSMNKRASSRRFDLDALRHETGAGASASKEPEGQLTLSQLRAASIAKRRQAYSGGGDDNGGGGSVVLDPNSLRTAAINRRRSARIELMQQPAEPEATPLDDASSEWVFLDQDGAARGPFSREDMKHWLSRGELAAETLVLPLASTRWQALNTVAHASSTGRWVVVNAGGEAEGPHDTAHMLELLSQGLLAPTLRAVSVAGWDRGDASALAAAEAQWVFLSTDDGVARGPCGEADMRHWLGAGELAAGTLVLSLASTAWRASSELAGGAGGASEQWVFVNELGEAEGPHATAHIVSKLASGALSSDLRFASATQGWERGDVALQLMHGAAEYVEEEEEEQTNFLANPMHSHTAM